MSIKFLVNKNTNIFRQTGSGKNPFHAWSNPQKVNSPFSQKYILYVKSVAGIYEKLNRIEKQKITFSDGLNPDEMKTTEPALLVIDDFLLSNNKDVVEMFILWSHHKQISLFYLSQNLFPDCSLFRTMPNNSHYFVIFSKKKSTTQINRLAHQIFIGEDAQRTKWL